MPKAGQEKSDTIEEPILGGGKAVDGDLGTLNMMQAEMDPFSTIILWKVHSEVEGTKFYEL